MLLADIFGVIIMMNVPCLASPLRESELGLARPHVREDGVLAKLEDLKVCTRLFPIQIPVSLKKKNNCVHYQN